MMTWVVLAFTMEILSTVTSIDRVLQWGGDNWLLLPLLDEVLICAFWNLWLSGDAAHVQWRRSHGCRVLKAIIIPRCLAT